MHKDGIHELTANFSLFDDWEDRYRYLIDLGRSLPAMADELKTDETLVRGCTSRVWMVGGLQNGLFHFQADSDAHIVRGLVALLMAAYQDQPLEEIYEIDIEKIFRDIGLEEHLSPSRRNGFYAMVETIRKTAQQAKSH